MAVEFQVDEKKILQKAINKTIKQVQDLTVPYKLMTREWFKGNRSQFDLGRQGPGKYEDFTQESSDQKFRDVGFVYPILVRSGKLMRSMTQPRNPDAVTKIINKKVLTLGTKATSKGGAPYAFFLHFGTKFMPARPVVILGVEQVATTVQKRRIKIWVNMLNDFVVQKSEGFGINV